MEGDRRLDAADRELLERSLEPPQSFIAIGAPRDELGEQCVVVRRHDVPGLDAGIDSNAESIQLVNKQSLALVYTVLTPMPGKKAMHVEFTAEGDRALVSVWDADGALVVYDSKTLGETLRLPFAMPVGKYNAFNKTRALH